MLREVSSWKAGKNAKQQTKTERRTDCRQQQQQLIGVLLKAKPGYSVCVCVESIENANWTERKKKVVFVSIFVHTFKKQVLS